ncbi:MAG TPA: glutamine--tRNA ligase/YqeY domain fusion protein [Longimicrobiales bacterium]
MSERTHTSTESRAAGRDFVRAIVAGDVRAGTHGGRVVTRFPPEPNGYLHIGHAKSICLNFGIAAEFGGRCHLRFDDTNPETEDARYVESILEDVRWLGFDPGEHVYHAADDFETFYELAVRLIKKGKAYVDSQSDEEIRENRGTIAEPGRPGPYRDRSVEENLDLFRRMRAGEFPDGAHVLRAKIDLASPNMLMRDPVLYRIRHASHYRTGDAWCIYPLYDFAHPLEDAIEGVTHSICTLEFENNRELYDWVVRETEVASLPGASRPRQYEFARLNLDYTVMSKRKLAALVREDRVSGWDDPRMPTIAGLRRRGVTPEAIRSFCELIGVAKSDSRVDIGKLEYAVREDLNHRAPRVMCVLRPLRVVLTNWPEDEVEWLDAPYWPRDVGKEGTRKVPFSRVLYIERDDFMEDPPRGFFRLAPGREVRLRYGYVIRCDEVVKDENGEVVELRCSVDPATKGGAAPEGRRIKGTLHWVSAAHALRAEVRLYDRLFRVPDPDAAAAADDAGEDFRAFLNPESLVVIDDARIEPSVRDAPPGTRYQFERTGYFISDPVDSRPDGLVFNRTVTLRDGWAKVAGTAAPSAGRPVRGGTAGRRRTIRASAEAAGRAANATTTERETIDSGADGATPASTPAARAPEERAPATRTRPPELAARFTRYTAELGLAEEAADVLTRDAATAEFFEAALRAGAAPRTVANWVVNELPRELEGRDVAQLPFDGGALGELVALIDAGAISGSAGRLVLAEMAEHGGDPAEIVERRGLRQVSDAATLAPIVDDVVAAHPDKVTGYLNGRTGLLGFFVGQVMGRTRGRANPERVKALLEERLTAASGR